MKISWDPTNKLPQDAAFHHEYDGYRVYTGGDLDLLLYLVDQEGNVGIFDNEDTSYEDFEDWVGLALETNYRPEVTD